MKKQKELEDAIIETKKALADGDMTNSCRIELFNKLKDLECSFQSKIKLVTQLTTEIYKKYPLIWSKLKLNYNNQYLTEMKGYHYFFTNDGHIELCLNTNCVNCLFKNGWSELLPFSDLYNLLEGFFEIYEIYLSIHIACIIDNSIYYNSGVLVKGETIQLKTIDGKNEAKYNISLKACEILKEELK